jgi:NAD(P)-dependent dehydrogenase (short-subunit alcohol dehydrogenase family)
MSGSGNGIGRRELLMGGAATAALLAACGSEAATGAPPAGVAGRSVLITGTSSGFGRLMAEHLARGGAKVFATMRNLDGGARPEARELVALARAEGLDLSILELDVTDEAQVTAAVRAAEQAAGGALDAVINNAGIAFGLPVELGDLEATRLIFETNLFGAMRVAQAALPAMRARGQGWVCSVSSQLGRLVRPALGHYCSTKFGMEAMFEALAYELAPFGVDVTIVQPGGYPTRIWDNARAINDSVLARVPAEARTAYAPHLALNDALFQGAMRTDPMDVPRAVAAMLALPPGARPLRRPVAPNTAGVDAVNRVSADIQARMLGTGPFADWHARVANAG